MKEIKIVRYNKDLKANAYEEGNYFIYKGNMIFYLEDSQIVLQYFDDDYTEDSATYLFKNSVELQNYKDLAYRTTIRDIIEGEEFLSLVNSGDLTDYDGTISQIFVDGYSSNLGLYNSRICQGGFLVDEKIFKEICQKHQVLVNWANK